MFTDSLFDGDVDATVQTIKHHYDATGAFKTTTPSQRKRRPRRQAFSYHGGPRSKRSREDDRQGRTTNGYSHGTIGLYNASGSYNTNTGQPFRHQPSGATRGRWGQSSRKQGGVCEGGGEGGGKFNQKARLHHGPQGDESGKLSAPSPSLAGADGQPLCHSDRRRRLPARVPLQATHHGSLKGRSYGDKTRTSHFPPNGRRGAGSPEQRRHRKEPSFTRVFQHCLSRPKEGGQGETGHQPKTPQPIYTLPPLPNDIVERRVPFGLTQRLGSVPRPEGRLLSHPSAPQAQALPTVYLAGPGIPLQVSPIWPVFQPQDLHACDKTNSTLPTFPRHSGGFLPRRAGDEPPGSSRV